MSPLKNTGKCWKLWENTGKTLGKHWENTGKTLFLEGGELKYVPVCG